jgi:methionyl-tRNA synthetase
MAGSYFLTTAIDYVNSAPHLGHAYEKVLADFFARHQLGLEKDVLFLTGVDEHGQKVQQSAQRENIEPQAFVDQTSARFQELHQNLGVVSSKFVRTTDAQHKAVVRDWLQKLHDKGEIFFQEHEGFYSVRQEQFVTEKDQVDGQWPEIFGEVVAMKEPNYYFRLEPYRARLRQFIAENPGWIVPAFRRNELLGALEKPLDDLCISRPKSRLTWGIPLPFDENYVTSVWFDALVNYYSFADALGARRWRLLADHALCARPRVAAPFARARFLDQQRREDQQVEREVAGRSGALRGEVRPRRAALFRAARDGAGAGRRFFR